MKKTIAYLYKWTQLSTHRWYIGSRTKNGCHPEDGYLCSSKKVKPMILENRNDWKREVLIIGEPKYIVELEANYLKLLDAKNDTMSYNDHNGDGKFSGIINKGRKLGPLSEERKENIRQQRLGTTRSQETKTKQAVSMLGKNKGRKQSDKEKENRSIALIGIIRGPQTAEHKANLSKSKKGKISWNKGKKK